MTEEETIIDGISYISSKRASELTWYSQDYIGQLARSGVIEARRIGGLWFVNLESLNSHKSDPKTTKSNFISISRQSTDPDTFVAFDGKSYISASRASKLSGYNQDYIGQLARSGHILSRFVGNRWYVDQKSLLDHKAEKEALLASVQRDAVGIYVEKNPKEQILIPPIMNYYPESAQLIPDISEKYQENTSHEPRHHLGSKEDKQKDIDTQVRIPIHVAHHQIASKPLVLRKSPRPHQKPLRANFTTLIGLSASALTIVIVVSLGYSGLKGQSIYASVSMDSMLMPASVGAALNTLITQLEDHLAPPMVYRRTD